MITHYHNMRMLN